MHVGGIGITRAPGASFTGKRLHGHGNSGIETFVLTPSIFCITHCARDIHCISPYGTNSKKNGLSIFDWSYKDFCGVSMDLHGV